MARGRPKKDIFPFTSTNDLEYGKMYLKANPIKNGYEVVSYTRKQLTQNRSVVNKRIYKTVKLNRPKDKLVIDKLKKAGIII